MHIWPSVAVTCLLLAATDGAAAAPSWRAQGNEPGWALVVDEAGLELTLAYGERHLRAASFTLDDAGGTRVYRAAADGVTIEATVTDRVCTDTMTGMPYPQTVAVVTGSDRLAGCGGDPATLLQGGEWTVETIAGTPLAAGSSVTITFDAEGHVYGKASCNRFTGGYKLTGEGLAMGPLASTMMACADGLMEQERRFLELLAEAKGFAIAADGALSLQAAPAGRALATLPQKPTPLVLPRLWMNILEALGVHHDRTWNCRTENCSAATAAILAD